MQRASMAHHQPCLIFRAPKCIHCVKSTPFGDVTDKYCVLYCYLVTSVMPELFRLVGLMQKRRKMALGSKLSFVEQNESLVRNV